MANNPIRVKLCDVSIAQDWNLYVQSHPEHSPYHFWHWMQSVEQAYGHKMLAVAAFKNESIVGVLPLVEMSKLGMSRSFCSLPFCDIGGILADDDEIKQSISDFTTDLQSQRSAKPVELRERRFAITDEATLDGKKVSMILPLPSTSEELMASFKSKLRSQIRKAEKNGLTHELGNGPEFVKQFYQVLSVNMHRLGSPVHSEAWFQAVAQHYGSNCQIVLVKHENNVIGSGFILFSNDRACIPWASTLAEHNRLAPNMLVYWALLQFVTDHGCKEFDFGRSTFGEGTYKFKQQWGAKPYRLNWYRLGEGSGEQDTAPATQSAARQMVERVWRAMPLSLVNRLGPLLRKHISL